MTEQNIPTTPLGNVPVGNDIAGVHITFSGEELTWKRAARQLRIFADQLDAQTLDSSGFNWQYGGDFEMQVHIPDLFPHGDYQDDEGNLLHVADDHVISVIWASQGAEKEEVHISVVKWAQEHGRLTPAGEGEAGDHHHDH